MTFVVDLCGVIETINFDLSQLDGFDVVKYVKNTLQNKARIFVGIAGGPGSGKSLFSKMLCLYLNQKLNVRSVCLSSDGYHYDNKTLIQKKIRHEKGLPQSMDDIALQSDILKLQIQTQSNPIYLPKYDRSIHDPVPNAIEIKRDVQVIIIEGLFILYWKHILMLLDYAVFMDSKPEIMQKRLEERKLKCGSTLEEARANYENIDSKTIALTKMDRNRADCIIQTDSGNDDCIRYKQLPSNHRKKAKL